MIKKAVPIIASVILAGSMSITAYADGVLDKDYIVIEIWSDWWLDKGDDGTIFPEASYKHHLLTEWVDDNYDDDDYDWTDIGEPKYQFRDYYKDLIETWNFNDDNDGNWTISTEDTTYHFSFDNGKWLMIDSNGDTVDSFMPFSTLEEKTAPQPDNSNNSNSYRVEENLKIDTVSSSESEIDSNEVTAESKETADTGQNEGISNGLLYGIGTLIVAGLATIILLWRKKMIFQNDYQRIALDSDRLMITQCGKDYHDFSNDYYARIYIKWAVENCSERLQAETDKGSIYIHIHNKVKECDAEQWRIWLKMRETDDEYKLSLQNADTAKVWKLENLFEIRAREICCENLFVCIIKNHLLVHIARRFNIIFINI